MLVLCWHRGRNAGCWPSIATIVAETGKTERTVQRQLLELERAGCIWREFRAGRSSVYRFHTPATDDTPATNGGTATDGTTTPPPMAATPATNGTQNYKKKSSTEPIQSIDRSGGFDGEVTDASSCRFCEGVGFFKDGSGLQYCDCVAGNFACNGLRDVHRGGTDWDGFEK